MAAWSKKVKAPAGNVEQTKQTMQRYNACMLEATKARR
jgi:hypothetical protein